MPLVCHHCKEKAFDIDDQVCKACGVVSEDIQFGVESYIDSSFKPFQKNSSKKPRANVLDHGIETVSYLCHHYNVSADIKMETITLLKNVHAHQRKVGKKYRLKEDVSVLAGCCLMNIQKKNRTPIPITNLCSTLKCNKKKIFKMSKVLAHYLIDQNPSPEGNAVKCVDSINNSAEEVDTLEFLDSYVKNVLSCFQEEIKEVLIKRTADLVRLADSCWLLSGRSRIGVVAAAAYLSWKSLDPSHKLSLPRFCSQFSLNAAKAKMRVHELKAMLLKLGEKIPSITTNYVTEQNILFHLGYILENSESLRNDLLINESTVDEINIKEYNIFRSRFTKNKPIYNFKSAYDDDMNASDIEISDTEISSYIRSDKQLKLIKAIKESSELKNS